MKKIIIQVLSYAILILTIFLLSTKVYHLNTRLDNSINNIKAYAAENSNLLLNNRVFKSTITELEFYNDSLMLAMKKVANENNIKDRKIKALQYQLETFSKRDTIFIRDTIFKELDFVLDTCIMDEWSKSCLHLAYPGIISIANEYNNEKYITLHSHKEPVRPCKWFLPKLFVRKHTVVEVLVVDKNPYVTTRQHRYIEIIDK